MRVQEEIELPEVRDVRIHHSACPMSSLHCIMLAEISKSSKSLSLCSVQAQLLHHEAVVLPNSTGYTRGRTARHTNIPKSIQIREGESVDRQC